MTKTTFDLISLLFFLNSFCFSGSRAKFFCVEPSTTCFSFSILQKSISYRNRNIFRIKKRLNDTEIHSLNTEIDHTWEKCFIQSYLCKLVTLLSYQRYFKHFIFSAQKMNIWHKKTIKKIIKKKSYNKDNFSFSPNQWLWSHSGPP